MLKLGERKECNSVVDVFQQAWNEGEESNPPGRHNEMASKAMIAMWADRILAVLPMAEAQRPPDETAILDLKDATKRVPAGRKPGLRFKAS
jgi:hypothetical protein